MAAGMNGGVWGAKPCVPGPCLGQLARGLEHLVGTCCVPASPTQVPGDRLGSEGQVAAFRELAVYRQDSDFQGCSPLLCPLQVSANA